MLGEVVNNGIIIVCRHGSFPLAKMEDLFVRVLLGSPKIWLTEGDESNKWQREH
jgi:hypothetical protein